MLQTVYVSVETPAFEKHGQHVSGDSWSMKVKHGGKNNREMTYYKLVDGMEKPVSGHTALYNSLQLEQMIKLEERQKRDRKERQIIKGKCGFIMTTNDTRKRTR